jgi:hypothetical protein
MKQLYSTFAILILTLSLAWGQKLINLNPDPNGEPWYAGGLRKFTREDTLRLLATPQLMLPANYTKSTLPVSVDNSLHKYFRPVFNQSGGSCGQASGVGYNFTYAIDFARDLAANTTQTQYPTHYTWNFLNNGVGDGSTYMDGWDIIDANGCPTVATYGGSPWEGGDKRWISGYSNYYSGMGNRIQEVFTINVSTPEGLQTLKQWMNDQLNGSAVGGLANFSAGVSGTFALTYLSPGTPNEYRSVVTKWDPEINHAMTFIGYNDSIRYDYNKDGKFTNNIDINNDGVVDMRDWEKGGLIMVNSWGTSWADQGKAFVMYKTLAEPSSNGGIWANTVHVIRAKAQYAPLLTLKATITHESRKKLRVTAGISANPEASAPDFTMQLPLFNRQGGDQYMQGGTTEDKKTIEIGLDITPLLSYATPNQETRYFLVVNESDVNNASNGQIVSFSVIDHVNDNSETPCPSTNVPLNNNSTTYLSVNKSVAFDKVNVAGQQALRVLRGVPFEHELTATGGTAPYSWKWLIDYSQEATTSPFKTVSAVKLNPVANDDEIVQLDLPFEFPFYGNGYKTVYVSTDGSVLFSNGFEYVRSESNIKSNRVITAYGADLMLYASDNDGMWYQASKDSVIIYWKTSQFENITFNTQFSITLFPSGQIRQRYGSGITSGLGWAAGISNGDGDNYAISSISGTASVSDNTTVTFTPSEWPKGFNLNPEGRIAFVPEESGKQWDIRVKVTDQKRIFNTGTLRIESNPSLEITPEQLVFENPMDQDPFTTGKTLTIKNVCTIPVAIDSLNIDGFCWSVESNPVTQRTTLNPDESISLTVKLKENTSKGDIQLSDTIIVYTPHFVYSIPVLVDPAVFENTSYAITFNVSSGSNAFNGATISIDRLTNTITTNQSGSATITLPKGNYSYTITAEGHHPHTGSFTVEGGAKSIDIQLTPLGVSDMLLGSVSVYPNPFDREIQLTPAGCVTRYSLTNVLGQVVYSGVVEMGAQSITTNALRPGMYILILENATGGKKSFKLFKR